MSLSAARGDGYPVSSSTAAAPKEIGMLQRATGVYGGLEEIRERLSNFAVRLEGGPSAPPPPPGPAVREMPCGLLMTIAASEDSIRQILGRLSELEGAF